MQKFIILNGSSTNSTSEGYIVIPIKTFSGGHASSDTVVELYFEPILEDAETQGMDQFMVSLTITANKQKEVIADITAAINAARNLDEPMIVISDDSNSVFASPFISGCANTVTAEA